MSQNLGNGICNSNKSDIWRKTEFTVQNRHCFRIWNCARSWQHSKWYRIYFARKWEAKRTDQTYRTLHIHTNLYRVASKQFQKHVFFFFFRLKRVFQNYHTTTKSECFRTLTTKSMYPLLWLTHELAFKFIMTFSFLFFFSVVRAVRNSLYSVLLYNDFLGFDRWLFGRSRSHFFFNTTTTIGFSTKTTQKWREKEAKKKQNITTTNTDKNQMKLSKREEILNVLMRLMFVFVCV